MDFGDYVSLGADMAQLSRLRQLQEHLHSLSAIQEAEVAKQNYLSELKNIVFKISNNLNDLTPILRQNPKFAYLYIQQQLSVFSTYNIAPEVFKEFSDKEYVQKVLSTLNGLSTRIAQALSPDDIRQVEQALESIEQMPFLEQAIEMVEAKDKIKKLIPLSKAWNKSNEKEKMKDGAIKVVLIIGFFPIILLVVILSEYSFLLSMLIFGLIIFAVYFFASIFFKDDFKEKHPNFEQTWISLNQIAQTNNTEIWRKIQVSFETVNADDLKSLRDKRQSLITSIVPKNQ
jgi:hypothetical protein